jgi:hypothetical protein
VAAEADLTRFGHHVLSDVKSYFENQACPDWAKIRRGRGRPRHQVTRDLIQRLALTYLVATGRPPPACVRFDLVTEQPFLKFVRKVFECARITFGNIDSFINEREKQRRILELPELDSIPVTMEETRQAFEDRHRWRELKRQAAEDKKKKAAKAKAARAAQRRAATTTR